MVTTLRPASSWEPRRAATPAAPEGLDNSVRYLDEVDAAVSSLWSSWVVALLLVLFLVLV